MTWRLDDESQTIAKRAYTGKETGNLPRDDFEARAYLAANRLYGRVTHDSAWGNSIHEDCYDAILWAFREGEKVGQTRT